MSSETEIKKLRFRANHRGIKEMDIILGRFADECIESLSPAQISDFSDLMKENDQDLLKWVTGEAAFPHRHLQEIFDLLLKHVGSHSRDG